MEKNAVRIQLLLLLLLECETFNSNNKKIFTWLCYSYCFPFVATAVLILLLLLMYNVHHHTREQGITALCRSGLFFCFNILKSEDKFNTSSEETNWYRMQCTYIHTYKRTKGERKTFSTEMKSVFLLLMSSLYLVP